MKKAAYLYIILVCVQARGQVYTPVDSLILALQNFYAEKEDVALFEFSESNKYKSLNYLPSVGYDFFNHRPILTYNISDLAGYLNSKQIRKFKSISIQKGVTIELDQAKKNLTTNYLRLIDLFSVYDLEKDIYRFNLKLYNIELKKYENNEIPLEVFLKKEIEIREKQKNLHSLKERIYQAVIEIENLTNYNLNYEIKSYPTISSSSIDP